MVIERDERRTSQAGAVLAARESSELAEKTLEPLTLGVRKGTVFGSTFELELNEEIEFAGGKRSAFDRAAEKVPQVGSTLEGFPGGFEGVRFPRVIGPGRLQGRFGFAGRPLKGSAPHLPGNGKREIGLTRRKTRGSEVFEEHAQGLLRSVFAGESRIAFAHPADGRVQHGEKQENEDAVRYAAGEQGPCVEEFAEKRVGGGISVQRLQV